MPYGLPHQCWAVIPSRVSIPHMGCMPYGRKRRSVMSIDSILFQSLIWVACPTGDWVEPEPEPEASFNPSYGLHALRAGSPYCPVWGQITFQSLIWVACPTGLHQRGDDYRLAWVSIPHMGCMPYGPIWSTGSSSPRPVSIPHMGCMPYGPGNMGIAARRMMVSIPHMGCMPYGHGKIGPHTQPRHVFQSLIWVACPTGSTALSTAVGAVGVSIPHMGCMPYGRNGE